MKIQFYLRFHTSFGQTLWITDHGKDSEHDVIPMSYVNEEFWEASIELEKKAKKIRYHYILKNKNGEVIPEWGEDRVIDLHKDLKEIVVIDTWQHAGDIENTFYTAPFRQIFLKRNKHKSAGKKRQPTHIFRVKAPLLKKNEVVCLLGSTPSLGEWVEEDPILFTKDDNWWVGYADLSNDRLPVAYKYGVYDVDEKKFIRFEAGNNRLALGEVSKKRITIIHDAFIRLPNNTWKGAGVSIPVFSLRSNKSCGIGEFTDLKYMVDWAAGVGLKMIQILPVNDTTATHTWTDSYPYAAISAFALNPVYINIEKAAGKKNNDLVRSTSEEQKELNELPEVDYERVMKLKLSLLKELYERTGKDVITTEHFNEFFDENRHWLVPYAAFCYLRDKHGTSHFEQWPSNSIYNKKEIEKLAAPGSKFFHGIAFYYFVQYHLHVQLKNAVEYAHKKKIILKGDIPIGIYRYGADAWTDPELYNMCWQAGAPPDDFAVKGQNWGFPTYNWQKMQQDDFDWWRKRFNQMKHYFDAFRIDHILGFFRIWSIPMNAIEGIMGRFSPAIPVSLNEFQTQGILFDQQRYCEPYITREILEKLFGDASKSVIKTFLKQKDSVLFELKDDFKTQRQVEDHFEKKSTSNNEKIKSGLLELISNVILFEENDGTGEKFHFRIGMENTSSFNALDSALQTKLKQLYIDYFYRRQDEFWKKEAMHKLPELKSSTNMLVCGEDLGMVPHCVPEVMKDLGILSLEIQRMPKETGKEFFHPKDAPYLSVITPATHDMSTIRGWWEEDREKTIRFFKNELNQKGEVPVFCEPWINRAIIQQHLQSPAMWCVFQLQDLLGISETLRRKDPQEERINIPSNPKHYWRYRMHITLEDLQQQDEFNNELKGHIEHSGRA